MAEAVERERRVALVTGSVRGLGRAVARHLRGRGDLVHVVWRTPGPAAEASQVEFGDRSHRADLLHPGEIRDLVDDVVARDSRLDVLVHAVGEYTSGPLDSMPATDLRRMLASNVETAHLVLEATLPLLRARGGRAIFFGCGGLAGLRGRRTAAAYAAAKSALLVLVRSWAIEEAPHGVTVNMVSPGCIPHDDAHADTLDPARIASIPAGQAGTPEDVARAVEWLASREASYTTGTDLQVGGGWML
jgi:3-oxoacyl-[acyl-carrier protein] reductase